MIGRGSKPKYSKTDATPYHQYPHQTASGRREIRAASNQSNTPPVSPPREPRNSAARAYCGAEPTIHNSQLTSPSGSPHQPAVRDFQDNHQPSRTSPSPRPLSHTDTTAPQYHASSSPPRESSFDGGKLPKTWTRNSIRIPVRTRYAGLKPRITS